MSTPIPQKPAAQRNRFKENRSMMDYGKIILFKKKRKPFTSAPPGRGIFWYSRPD